MTSHLLSKPLSLATSFFDMHSFKLPLFFLAGLVTAQNHLGVFGADGVSVGYHADASSEVATPIDSNKATPEVSYTSQSLPPHVPPSEAQDSTQSTAEAIAMQPVVVSAPMESPSTGQHGATPSIVGTAPRSDGRCGAKFDNAVCDPNGMYGGCCS